MKGISLEFYKCKEDLDDSRSLLSTLKVAGSLIDGKIVESLTHRIEPHGVVVIVILSKSYITLHSYAKKKLCKVYLFNYDKRILKLEVMIKYLQEELGAKNYKIVE